MAKTRRRRRRPAFQRNTQNRLSMILVITVVVLLSGVVFYKKIELKDSLAAKETTISELENAIAEETSRTDEIASYKEYMQTDEYVEDVAREKLGLVYENEIVFMKEKE